MYIKLKKRKPNQKGLKSFLTMTSHDLFMHTEFSTTVLLEFQKTLKTGEFKEANTT